MYIYITNIILILIWAFINKFIKQKKYNYIVFILFIQLFLIAALRDLSVGADTIQYIRLYNRAQFMTLSDFIDLHRHEVGYLILVEILSFFGSNQIFIAIMAAIPLTFFSRFIQKESKMPWLSIYLFVTLGFFTTTLVVFRQAIALGVITVSYKYLKEKRPIKFIVSTLIAALFHISALVFIPIYFFRNLKLNLKNSIFYFIALITVLVFGERVIMLALNLFSSIEYNIESSGGLTLLITLVLILLVSLIYKEKVLSSNPDSIILYNILLFGIVIQILALDFSLFTRVTTYYRFFLVLFIPEILYSIKNRYEKTIGVFLVLGLTFMQYLITLINNLGNITPYIFFWQ